MSESFSFSFSGDDIEEGQDEDPSTYSKTIIPDDQPAYKHAAERGTFKPKLSTSNTSTAFPVAGQTLLPAKFHDLSSLLSTLPSKISYSTLHVKIDDGTELQIPRREWWDVKVQLMAEEIADLKVSESEKSVGLGKEDVKTGVYEGGFKSWEASVDLVRVLADRRECGRDRKIRGRRMLEMGCGTALPSLALFQWQFHETDGQHAEELCLSFADYNPSVLQLVTLPNVLLSWAQWQSGSSWDAEGELDIDDELLSSFIGGLQGRNITLSFFSGAWSPEFVQLVTSQWHNATSPLLVLAAETIYSPMALRAFTESLMTILDAEERGDASALVAAKKIYFGVGGSIEDFCGAVRARGGVVEQIREESDGVRRAVVKVRNGTGA